MAHHDQRLSSTRAEARVARPVDFSGALFALLGALILFLLLL